MSVSVEKSLGTFERKILLKLFGAICVNRDYLTRMNHELYELYDDVELAGRVKIQWLRPSGGSRRKGRLLTR